MGSKKEAEMKAEQDQVLSRLAKLEQENSAEVLSGVYRSHRKGPQDALVRAY